LSNEKDTEQDCASCEQPENRKENLDLAIKYTTKDGEIKTILFAFDETAIWF